ncbi:MAG: hypothetical protein WC782_10860 [Methylococcaceae bacterium]|jgi:hypothetical protein
MADILAFKLKKKVKKQQSDALCRSGFHKWEVLNDRRFDVKQGKLVTAYQCTHCGKLKNTLV